MIVWITVVVTSGLGAPVVSVTCGRGFGDGAVSILGTFGLLLLCAIVFIGKMQELSWQQNAYTIFACQLPIICAATAASGIYLMYEGGLYEDPDTGAFFLPVIINTLSCLVYFPLTASLMSQGGFDPAFYQQFKLSPGANSSAVEDALLSATFGPAALLLSVASAAIAASVMFCYVRVRHEIRFGSESSIWNDSVDPPIRRPDSRGSSTPYLLLGAGAVALCCVLGATALAQHPGTVAAVPVTSAGPVETSTPPASSESTPSTASTHESRGTRAHTSSPKNDNQFCVNGVCVDKNG